MQHLLSNFREKISHTSQVEKLYDLWVCTYFYVYEVKWNESTL